MATFLNADGLVTRTGRDQGSRGSRAGVTSSLGKIQELCFEVALAGAARTTFTMDRNRDGTNDGFSGLDTPIPTGARIISQRIITVETPAGGTSFQVGTFTEAGAVVVADGIRTAAGGDGSQINTQATQNLFVAMTTTGTYTAGRVKVIVEYMIR